MNKEDEILAILENLTKEDFFTDDYNLYEDNDYYYDEYDIVDYYDNENDYVTLFYTSDDEICNDPILGIKYIGNNIPILYNWSLDIKDELYLKDNITNENIEKFIKKILLNMLQVIY